GQLVLNIEPSRTVQRRQARHRSRGENRMRALKLSFAVLVCVAAVGCASQTPYRAGTLQQIRYGEVIDTKEIQVEGYSTRVGTWGGASVGRAVGYTKGGDRLIAGAIGGVAGAIAGEALEKKARAKDGFEITVRMDDGSTVAVIQEADAGTFEAGDR